MSRMGANEGQLVVPEVQIDVSISPLGMRNRVIPLVSRSPRSTRRASSKERVALTSVSRSVQTFTLPGSMYISILFGAAYGMVYGLFLSCIVRLIIAP